MPPILLGSTTSAGVQRATRLPNLVPCPRPTYLTGQDDWYQIGHPKLFEDVDICPDCYDATFRNTPYAHCIVKAAPKPEGVATKCDMSLRWVRAATFWLFSQNSPDLSLLGYVATLPQDGDGVCPNLNVEDPLATQGGKRAALRTWYCLYDPRTSSLIEDLTACSSCINCIKTIFPHLDGLFRPMVGGAKIQATCDLLTAQNEHDGRRGEHYLNQLFELENQTLRTGARDVGPIINYIRKWARIPVCRQSEHIPKGTLNYTFPLSMPNYATCEECYTRHILPIAESASPPPFFQQLRAVASPNGFVCDLYSPQLQQWFRDVCFNQDFTAYKKKLLGHEATLNGDDPNTLGYFL